MSLLAVWLAGQQKDRTMTKKVKTQHPGDRQRLELVDAAKKHARWIQGQIESVPMADAHRPYPRELADLHGVIPLQDLWDSLDAESEATQVCLKRNVRRRGRPRDAVKAGSDAKKYHMIAANWRTYKAFQQVLKIFGKAINPNVPPI